LPKSKKITTTDWSQHELTTQQILYAANDAYAALKVLESMNLRREDLPIMGLSRPKQYSDKGDLWE